MATSQSKYGRRFDEEFKREVAALAWRPGARQEQTARGLWAAAPAACRAGRSSPAAVSPHRARPSFLLPLGFSVAELERRIRAPERENADLRGQSTLLEKSGRHLLRTPAMKRATIQRLAGPTRGTQALPGARRGARAPLAPSKGSRRVRAPRPAPGSERKARERFEASGRTGGSARLGRGVAACG